VAHSRGRRRVALVAPHLANRSVFIRSVMTTPAVDRSGLIDPPSPDMLQVTSLGPKPAAAAESFNMRAAAFGPKEDYFVAWCHAGDIERACRYFSRRQPRRLPNLCVAAASLRFEVAVFAGQQDWLPRPSVAIGLRSSAMMPYRYRASPSPPATGILAPVGGNGRLCARALLRLGRTGFAVSQIDRPSKPPRGVVKVAWSGELGRQ
jgi:hypothetical protein